MFKTVRVANFFGIPIQIHWTLFVLFGLAVGTAFNRGGLSAASLLGGYIIVIALSVLLHEYGHIYAAHRFGIKTKGILLTPLGGMANMAAYPGTPWKRFAVAVSGPLVSLVLFGLFTVLMVMNAEWDQTHGSFFAILSKVNFYIFLFNLIPLYPMDGGQIIHSVFSSILRQKTADQCTLRLSQVMAVGVLSYGIWDHSIILPLIAIMMFLFASAEFKDPWIMRFLERDVPVREAGSIRPSPSVSVENLDGDHDLTYGIFVAFDGKGNHFAYARHWKDYEDSQAQAEQKSVIESYKAAADASGGFIKLLNPLEFDALPRRH